MAEYIEEYLVALGFDLDSTQGKEYLAMCNDLENRQNALIKAGESATVQAKKQSDVQKGRIADGKDEIHLMEQMEEASRRLKQQDGLMSTTTVKTVNQEETVRTIKEAAQGPSEPPHMAPENSAAPSEKPPASQSPREVPRANASKVPRSAAPPMASPTGPAVPTPDTKPENYKKTRLQDDRKEINLMGDLEKTLKQVGSAWVQLEHGNIFGAFTQGSKGVKQFVELLNEAGSSTQATDKNAKVLKKTLSDVFGIKKKADGAKAISTASEDAVATGGGDEAAAGESGATGAASIAGVAVGSAAVAVALGKAAKSVYDLADGVAQTNINIETMARRLWISDSAAYQLNGTLSAMGKTTADLNEIAINPTLRQQFQDLQKAQMQLPKDFDDTNKKWAEEVSTPLAEVKALWGYLQKIAGYKIEQSIGPKLGGAINGFKQFLEAEGLSHGLITPDQLKQQYAPPAPTQNYSSYTEGSKIEYSPHIEVHADSNSAQSIADATAKASRQSFGEAALIKSVQGLSR